MNIGQLRHTVTIETKTEVNTADGLEENWSGLGTRKARVEESVRDERLRAMQIDARLAHRVVMRAPDPAGPIGTITSKQRLLYKGRTLKIRSVAFLDAEEAVLELICEEDAG